MSGNELWCVVGAEADAGAGVVRYISAAYPNKDRAEATRRGWGFGRLARVILEPEGPEVEPGKLYVYPERPVRCRYYLSSETGNVRSLLPRGFAVRPDEPGGTEEARIDPADFAADVREGRAVLESSLEPKQPVSTEDMVLSERVDALRVREERLQLQMVNRTEMILQLRKRVEVLETADRQNAVMLRDLAAKLAKLGS